MTIPSQMKAVVSREGLAAVRTVAVPRLSSRDDVIVKVAIAGLCRTDVSVALGKLPVRDSLILGHEFSGRIAATAPGATGLAPGARVTVNPVIPCGACELCARHAPRDCEAPEFLGVQRDGAFAEYIAVPAASVHELPASISFLAAAFTEPVAASLAVLKAGILPHERGLIFGDNRIARLTERILRARGFRDVTVRSPGDPELERNHYDYIIETVATTESLAQMVRAIRPRGKIVLKSREPELVGFRPSEILRKEPVFHAVNYGSFPDAIELIGSGNLNLESLAAAPRKLDEFSAVLEDAARGETKKPLFLISEE